MFDSKSTRRNFFKFLGLTAGTTLMSQASFGAHLDSTEIKKLTDEQKEFILLHEKWMDEFIEVIRVQKTAPEDQENNKKMITITEMADAFKPKLDEFMKDGTFAFIYKMSLERMSKEI
jgi:DNA replication initiation complex subunit (GINS family)